MKTCKTCQTPKPIDQFYRHPGYSDGRFADCIVCVKAQGAAYRANNKSKIQQKDMRYRVQKRYGIAADVYEAMVIEQDGKCAICRQPDPRRLLSVDHNHKTGKVRGLLCHSCNVMIGHAKDNPTLLETAAAYLR